MQKLRYRQQRTHTNRQRLLIEPLENRFYLSSLPILTLNLDPVSLTGHFESGGLLPGTSSTATGQTGEFTRAAEAINQFALDLYEHFQQQDGNLFLSPMSIATALAMTYAGAGDETATQIADVFHFGTESGIHDSFRALLESLDPADDSRPFELDVANALWPQIGYPFKESFLQLIASQYGGNAQGLDYCSSPEAAREVINTWVEEQTHDKIEDLIPKGAINKLTRFVLTNAIYFKGQWVTEFDPKLTVDRPFYLASGENVDVPTMSIKSDFCYCERDGFQVLEMPYKGGDLSMVILLPKVGTNTEGLSGDTLADVNEWLNGTSVKQDVIVRLPKFKTTVDSSLNTVLEGMGMTLAFDPGRADFSGMVPLEVANHDRLNITDVIHKAFVEVNEEGTEAAAATAVIGGAGCFSAGTLVLTPAGAKPIETLQPGDLVLSRPENDPDADVKPKPIEEMFDRTAPTLDVKVAGQTIRTTREHPFHVKGQGWVPAGKLKPGDLLASSNGQWFEVKELVDTGLVETVYNFRVAVYHTYFVGHDAWDCGLWVHNSYMEVTPPIEFNADHPFHFFIRDNQTETMLFMGRMDDPQQEENSVNPEAVETEPSNGELRRYSPQRTLPPSFIGPALPPWFFEPAILPTAQQAMQPLFIGPLLPTDDGLPYCLPLTLSAINRVDQPQILIQRAVDSALREPIGVTEVSSEDWLSGIAWYTAKESANANEQEDDANLAKDNVADLVLTNLWSEL